MTKQVKIIGALLAAAVALSCLFLMRPKDNGTVALVKQDGVLLAEIDLSALTGPYTFPVDGENGLCNEIVAESGRIRVQEATCPDQICVNQGWISDSTVPIVCLPNKLVIEIVGEEGMFDAAAK